MSQKREAESAVSAPAEKRQKESPDQKESSVTREYQHLRFLKYGCNPQQKPASISVLPGMKAPFTILNGKPGYINLLDALNAWQLVCELKTALDLPAAASFKHVSPAGAAVYVPLDDILKEIYDVGDKVLTPLAVTYLRARHADPKSSFGDFAALSEKVDEETAKFLKREVCDGIIAPDFDEKALAILKTKKKGNFIILKGDVDYKPPEMEYREVYGLCFSQKRNDVQLTKEHLKNIVTENKNIPDEAVRDLLVASIALKYTQSNSVAYAVNGQVIGVGAGQQSRIDCVMMAGRKVDVWYLRQHPKVRGLKFKPKTKLVSKRNARIQYIQGGMTTEEKKAWDELMVEVPPPLTTAEKDWFLSTLKGISLSSDAFFPFRDNIDQASKRGVQYIAQPGGSVQDKTVTYAADQYQMAMAMTGVRLFHH